MGLGLGLGLGVWLGLGLGLGLGLRLGGLGFSTAGLACAGAWARVCAGPVLAGGSEALLVRVRVSVRLGIRGSFGFVLGLRLGRVWRGAPREQ